MKPKIKDERGVALVLALLLMMAVSLAAASMLVMAETETFSTMNYRLMSQARYGGEAGIQKSVNYLLNSYTPPPGVAGADPLAAYDTTVSPVTFNGQPVILSADTNTASNYPVSAVQTAFAAGLQGTLAAGPIAVNYAPSAKLLSMQQVQVYGGGFQTIQAWEITSNGKITTGKQATVQVTAILEQQKVPAGSWAAFSTNPSCGSLQFGGSSATDSYDSSLYSGSGALNSGNGGAADSGGDVGTNGNLGESGNATIRGTLQTPRVGVGGCSAGNVNALSSSGNAKLCPDPAQACTGIQSGGVLNLPQAISMPTPALPSPMPPTTNVSASNCAALALSAPATCSVISGKVTVDPQGSPVAIGNLSMTGSQNLVLLAGTYNINSLAMAGNTSLGIGSSGSVVINIAGKDSSGNWLATPLNLTGGSMSNSSMDSSKLQIQYAGTGSVVFKGDNSSSEVIYAPNAAGTLIGNTGFYGSIITSTLDVTGNADIHYDRHLAQVFYVLGNPMMSAFSWNKY